MQISASVNNRTVELIKEVAKNEKRTFSQMVNVILTDVAIQWQYTKKSGQETVFKPNKQQPKMSATKVHKKRTS